MFMAVNITKNIVSNDTIIIQTHLAAAIAHYQIWKEVWQPYLFSLTIVVLVLPYLLIQIVANDLAFGIIFEDDVDIDTDVAKCVIKSAISELIRDATRADTWSILYLDYSSEHNFSEEAIEVCPFCNDSLSDNSLTHSQNKLNETCIDAARFDAPNGNSDAVNLIRMSEYCSSGSTRAYVVSYHGARQLTKLIEEKKIKTNMVCFM